MRLNVRSQNLFPAAISILSILFAIFLLPGIAYGSPGDLMLSPENVRFSANVFLEGKTSRIYAAIDSASSNDLRGIVRFYDGDEQIQGDQPVSVLAGREDAVFVDWKPAAPGVRTIKILLIPFENEGDNPANNSFEKTITVLADTDRDGVPNSEDADDDNDGVKDTEDAFPLNKNEWVDSDGDAAGNNKDEDDDNDGVKDSEDAFPLDPNETKDSDKDGVGNNEDIFPLDPTQARDFDKDGVSDAKDSDADNDGIPKDKDANDTNLGPKIIVTTNGKSSKRIFFPNESVQFETTASLDPDGKIAESEWILDGEKLIGQTLETKFPKPGIHKITAKLTDDKGETRERIFSVYIASPLLPWLGAAILFLIFILAIFLLFFYSRRRRSKWQKTYDFLDAILKFLPPPRKKL